MTAASHGAAGCMPAQGSTPNSVRLPQHSCLTQACTKYAQLGQGAPAWTIGVHKAAGSMHNCTLAMYLRMYSWGPDMDIHLF